ncbi:carboxypeptidase-like regulatory domain-containing protein [Winogradskyella rapida]|uniref:Carboxypeptidase-like regulatory domain-containing protein n=1 Tax=Winogradskyella rapida TaxID=549701 RepID=A0ABW3KPZ2_9FLAO
MKLYFSFFLFIIYCLPVNSQILEGFVFDSTNQKKLPFVNISLKNVNEGTYTDENGYYKLDLKNIKIIDTLIISFIGFEKKAINLNKYKDERVYNLNIALSPKKEELNEVIISSKEIEYELFSNNVGTNRKGSFISSVPFGYEVCLFINNDKNKKAKLNELKLNLKKREYTNIDIFETYYRISFYKKNPVNNYPGDLISYENIIIKPENKNGKIEVNLSNKNIFLPRDGIFIGIETINPNKKLPENNMYLTSPNLLYTHSKEKMTYRRYRGKEWKKENKKSVFKKGYFAVPYLNLKVNYFK